jgi:hypothetical protein
MPKQTGAYAAHHLVNKIDERRRLVSLGHRAASLTIADRFRAAG